MAEALVEARQVQEDAARSGFDWPDVSGALAKLREETSELQEAIDARDARATRDEIGDLLFSIVNVSRFVDVRAEDALRATTEKFKSRYASMTRTLQAKGKSLKACTLEEMDAAWEAVKKKEVDGGSSA